MLPLRRDTIRLAGSAMLALAAGTAFVYGGYWIPPVELRVALSPLVLAGVAIALRAALMRAAAPSPAAKLGYGAAAVAVWFALFAVPYLARSFALRAEVASLPAWNGERPFVRMAVVASNTTDYEAVQIARDSPEKVERFYRAAMEARGWRFEQRLDKYERSDGLVYLIFARGRRKIAFHLGSSRRGGATAVEIFRVSFMPGAEEPGTGRRAWYRWVRRFSD